MIQAEIQVVQTHLSLRIEHETARLKCQQLHQGNSFFKVLMCMPVTRLLQGSSLQLVVRSTLF
jgi:hypothetical protein